MSKSNYLHFHRPWFGPEERRGILRVLDSGWVTTGPCAREFERRFARYVRAPRAVALNSCTAALHLSLAALDIGPGHEVVTTPLTFAATANVICHVGARPVFADIEPDTLNLDMDQAARAVTKQTRAVIPVHFAGVPCDLDPLLRLARKCKFAVIQDAAHAIETEYKGKRLGALGDAACYSFYATKNITTGEGGMLTTRHCRLAERAQILSLHGISRDAWKRYSDSGYRHWDILEPGFKYNMSDLTAALGIPQLARIEKFWRLRRERVRQYCELLAGTDEIGLLSEVPYGRSAYHLFVVLIRSEKLNLDRDEVMDEMQKQGVGIGIHFRAVHLHPYYRKTFGFGRGDFPRAEYASDRVLSLPLFPRMTPADVQRAAGTLLRIIRRARKRR